MRTSLLRPTRAGSAIFASAGMGWEGIGYSDWDVEQCAREECVHRRCDRCSIRAVEEPDEVVMDGVEEAKWRRMKRMRTRMERMRTKDTGVNRMGRNRVIAIRMEEHRKRKIWTETWKFFTRRCT